MTSNLCEIVQAPGNKLHCPEHVDKTPSLHIFEQNGFCFSCRKRFSPEEILAIAAKPTDSYTQPTTKKARQERIDPPVEFYELCRKLQRRFQDSLEKHPATSLLCSQRGFNPQQQRRAGLGCIPHRGELLSFLTSLSLNDSAAIPLTSLERYKGAGLSYQLTFPLHSVDGMLVGWGLRRTGGTTDGPKYLKTLTSRTTTSFNIDMGLFNIHRCNLRGRPVQCLYVVESELDALLLQSRGVVGAVALGTSQPKEEHVKHAAGLGVKSAVYIPDCDSAGAEGVSRARSMFEDNSISFHPVEWPVKFTGFKDVGELVVGRGVFGFVELVRSVVQRTPHAMAEWKFRGGAHG